MKMVGSMAGSWINLQMELLDSFDGNVCICLGEREWRRNDDSKLFSLNSVKCILEILAWRVYP